MAASPDSYLFCVRVVGQCGDAGVVAGLLGLFHDLLVDFGGDKLELMELITIIFGYVEISFPFLLFIADTFFQFISIRSI